MIKKYLIIYNITNDDNDEKEVLNTQILYDMIHKYCPA